jgi:hypothetical protein
MKLKIKIKLKSKVFFTIKDLQPSPNVIEVQEPQLVRLAS